VIVYVYFVPLCPLQRTKILGILGLTMTTKYFADSPIDVVEKSDSLLDGGGELLVHEDVDHDDVYSTEEQKRIIRRM
jgi:hypothetical protein